MVRRCNWDRATFDAIEVIRKMHTPEYIKNNYRVCVNCDYWNSKNGVYGKCSSNIKLAPYKNLNTLYKETCCCCTLLNKILENC